MKTFRVRDNATLAGLVHWARRLPPFDSTDPNGDSVKIEFSGRIIASVVCADSALRWNAERIVESVRIRREDGCLPAPVDDTPLFALAA